MVTIGNQTPTTPDQVKEYIESYPSRLACWRHGREGIHRVLVRLNVCALHALSQSTSVFEDLQRQVDIRNAAARGALWTLCYMNQGTDPWVPARAIEEVWTTALSYSRLQSLLMDVRSGYRGFESRGNKVRLSYKGNRDLYALGSFLGTAESKESTPTPRLSPVQSARFNKWLNESQGKVNWFRAPNWARAPFRYFAKEMFFAFPADMSTNTEFQPGLKTRDLYAYQVELMSLHLYDSILLAANDNAGASALCPVLSRKVLLRHVCETTNMEEEAADAFTELLTMDPTRNVSPALTPLVPVEDGLMPMSSIVSLTPQRSMLELLKTDTHRRVFGRIGNLLGDEGEEVAATLLAERMPECKVGRHIQVTRKNGDHAGDLDVVVCSPRERSLVIFETKWGLGVERLFHDLQVEEEALPAKRAQLRRLQREIGSEGTTVLWPRGWPDIAEFDWRWAVLTRYVLPEMPVKDRKYIPSTSYQLLKRTLRCGASVKGLLDLIYDPPIPEASTRWTTDELGLLKVCVEMMNEPTFPVLPNT